MHKNKTINESYEQAVACLKGLAHVHDPKGDVRYIFQHILGIKPEVMLLHPERRLRTAQSTVLHRAVTKRYRGLPMAYIVGNAVFYGRKFSVSPAVLIPRPETEELVEMIMRDIAEQMELRQLIRRFPIVDVGTGSGCIAITLSKELGRKQVKIIGRDVSAAALRIAKKNAKLLRVTSVSWQRADGLTGSLSKYAIIVSNPPYLTLAEMREPTIQAEPGLALYGGSRDGLEIIRRLLPEIKAYLHPVGLCYIEVGVDHAKKIVVLARALGLQATVMPDLAKKNRFIILKHA